MKYEVKDASIRGRKHLFSKAPLPDILSFQVVRMDDSMVMETWDTQEAAASSAAARNERDKDFSLDDLYAEYARND